MTKTTTAALSGSPSRLNSLANHGIVRGSIGLTIISLVGFGFLYSLAGVGLGQALFPHTANGSLIERDGKVIGSALIAQPFVSDKYFQPRPSAGNYDPMATAGSNQARTNPEMRKRLEDTRAAIAQREQIDPTSVPGDLYTESGGGLDPHITVASAAIQVNRIAQVRGIPRAEIDRLVAQHIEPKQLGLLGQARVNVLELNLALDALTAQAPH